MSSHMIDEASTEISQKLFSVEEFKASSIIFLYASKSEEVQTKKIFDYAKKMNKQVAFPKVCSHMGTMQFYVVDVWEELVMNKYKNIELAEPDPDKHIEVIPNNQTVMIAPGIAFDYNKNRIGYGGGFYDKYLNLYPTYVIGVCFDFQIVDRIEADPLDYSISKIVSEKRIID